MSANSPRYRFRQGQETNLINQRAHTLRNRQSPLLCLTPEINHGDHAKSKGQFQVHSTQTHRRDGRPQSEKGELRDFPMVLHPPADVWTSLKLHLFDVEFQQMVFQHLPPPLRSATSVHHLMWTLQKEFKKGVVVPPPPLLYTCYRPRHVHHHIISHLTFWWRTHQREIMG